MVYTRTDLKVKVKIKYEDEDEDDAKRSETLKRNYFIRIKILNDFHILSTLGRMKRNRGIINHHCKRGPI